MTGIVTALQLDALQVAGCGRVYTEKASGAQRDRPELKAALDYAREGDTLVVWKLTRQARSVAAGLAEDEDEDATDGDGRGGPAQGMASSSRTGMARVIPSRLSQVAKTQGRSPRSIRSP